MQNLRDCNIGIDELFASLREQGYTNLGQIRQAYLETLGRFSTFRAEPPHLGLPIEPAWEVTPPKMYGPCTQSDKNLTMTCCGCGKLDQNLGKTPNACAHCGGKAWATAIMS